MYEKKVLDHGFVKLRNLAGPTRRLTTGDPVYTSSSGAPEYASRAFDADDTDVANAARLSFDAMDQERTYDIEMKLTRYLMKHHHDTPFEVIQVWLEMKLPIFVARQFVRQRTQTINEASARYITLPAEWYIPEVVGGKPVGSVKQGQQDNLDDETQTWFRFHLNQRCANDYEFYLNALKRGVAPEHARMFLHLNHYTHWMQSMNLRNLFFSLLRLRWDSHAQVEAQAFAKAVAELLEPHIPGLMKLYREFFRGEVQA
jgi:thymidylate synthase (FAD)